MEGGESTLPSIFPPLNAPIPSGIIIKHIVPRPILVDLLDKARLWHNFTSDPTSAITALLTKQLQHDGAQGLDRYPALLKLQQDLKDWFGNGGSNSDNAILPPTSSTTNIEPTLNNSDNWSRVLSVLPISVQGKCEDLVNKLRNIPHLINCTSSGSLSVHDKVIPSSNAGDILHCLMRLHPIPPQFSHQPEKYWKSRGIAGLDEFVKAYAESNLPASLIRNSWFAKRVHKLRGDLSHSSRMVMWSNK